MEGVKLWGLICQEMPLSKLQTWNLEFDFLSLAWYKCSDFYRTSPTANCTNTRRGNGANAPAAVCPPAATTPAVACV